MEWIVFRADGETRRYDLPHALSGANTDRHEQGGRPLPRRQRRSALSDEKRPVLVGLRPESPADPRGVAGHHVTMQGG
jgi:hypothetical protein